MSLPTPSQSVSHKRLLQCVNHKKKLSLRHPLPTSGSFSFFQASIWLGVNKVLQKVTKSYKNELRYLFQCCILIPRKCPHKNPLQHTVRGEGARHAPPQILADQITLSQLGGVDYAHHITTRPLPPADLKIFRRPCFSIQYAQCIAVYSHFSIEAKIMIWANFE